jgi:UDP-N-acetylglucosamine--N-acetylmuramyl-(pentapeptide) pyrophosphoryl-undecaprenol N-acetylglucosamine transferase
MLCVGNPVRPAIADLFDTPYVPPGENINLLVLGGSLGARVFSDVVPGALAALPAKTRARVHVVQQCRQEDVARVKIAYDAAGIEAELAPFFGEVAQKYAAAHLVISRAGASSCAEIATTGKPAILVPLPGAIDDHQTENARALAQAGAASVISQSAFSPALLTRLLAENLADIDRLSKAANAAKACARPHAAAALADLVENMMSRGEAVS